MIVCILSVLWCALQEIASRLRASLAMLLFHYRRQLYLFLTPYVCRYCSLMVEIIVKHKAAHDADIKRRTQNPNRICVNRKGKEMRENFNEMQ